MSYATKGIVAVALSALLSGPALAQTTRNQGQTGGTSAGGQGQVAPAQPGTTGAFRQPLYSNQNVQRSLTITPEQLSRLNAAGNQLRTRFEQDLAGLDRLDVRQRATRRNDLTSRFDRELMTSTADILNAEQMNRYRQLDLQSRGLGVFADTDVQRRLRLTDDQQARLRELRADYDRQFDTLSRAAAQDREGALRRYEEMRRRDADRLNQILTAEQQRTWREMTGDPFAFPPDFAAPRR